jgi:hypothetical protein
LGLIAWVWMDGILLAFLIIFVFRLGCLFVWAGEIFAYWALSSGENWNYLGGFGLVGLLHYVWLQ